MIIDKPWGKVATYALNQPASVRMITVEPEQETSVHYHRMRDEMWVVLDPGLTVEIGNRVVEAQAGEEFMVAGGGDPPDPQRRQTPRPGARDRVRIYDRGRHAAARGRLRASARGGLVMPSSTPEASGTYTDWPAGQIHVVVRAPARPVLVFRKR